MIYRKNNVQIRPTHKIAIDETGDFRRSVESLRTDPDYGVEWLHDNGVICIANTEPRNPDEFTTQTVEMMRQGDGYYYWVITDIVVDEEAKAAHEAEVARLTRIEEIRTELFELDAYVPRGLEDLIESGVVQKNKFSTWNQERIDKKNALRVELSGL